MSRILVTGGAGFLGSHLCARLMKEGNEVLCVDNLCTGSMTPLNQLSSISVVEGRQLMIKPFDRNMLKEIERAVAMADLGLVPQNDGSVIRIMIPALTEDRRKELSKDAHKMGEEAKIAIRNIRRDAANAAKKDAELTEDLKKQAQDDIQKATDQFTAKVDKIVDEKCKDIMSV